MKTVKTIVLATAMVVSAQANAGFWSSVADAFSGPAPQVEEQTSNFTISTGQVYNPNEGGIIDAVDSSITQNAIAREGFAISGGQIHIEVEVDHPTLDGETLSNVTSIDMNDLAGKSQAQIQELIQASITVDLTEAFIAEAVGVAAAKVSADITDAAVREAASASERAAIDAADAAVSAAEEALDAAIADVTDAAGEAAAEAANQAHTAAVEAANEAYNAASQAAAEAAAAAGEAASTAVSEADYQADLADDGQANGSNL